MGHDISVITLIGKWSHTIKSTFLMPHTFANCNWYFTTLKKIKSGNFGPKITKFILFTDFYLHHTLFLFPWKARLCLNFRWCYCPQSGGDFNASLFKFPLFYWLNILTLTFFSLPHGWFCCPKPISQQQNEFNHYHHHPVKSHTRDILTYNCQLCQEPWRTSCRITFKKDDSIHRPKSLIKIRTAFVFTHKVLYVWQRRKKLQLISRLCLAFWSLDSLLNTFWLCLAVF